MRNSKHGNRPMQRRIERRVWQRKPARQLSAFVGRQFALSLESGLLQGAVLPRGAVEK
jgi:hypothetical protein